MTNFIKTMTAAFICPTKLVFCPSKKYKQFVMTTTEQSPRQLTIVLRPGAKRKAAKKRLSFRVFVTPQSGKNKH